MARIDWARPVAELDRLIRGCDPSPGAHADLAGNTVRLFGSRVLARESAEPAGTLLGYADGRLLVAATGGVLSVAKVRVADQKKVAADESGLAPDDRLA